MSNPITRRTLLGAATATVLALAIAPMGVCRADTLARVDVYDRGAGEVLTEYRHLGRRYVVGEPGNEYAVRIRNCSGQRLLAVLSVDGVNAVTGESASPDQAGYVLEPGGYVNIQGWRKDLSRTAAFYFSDPADSYAAQTGRPHDLGVIGVALFRERPVERQTWLSKESRSERSDTPARAESDAASDAKASRAAGATAAAPAMQLPSLGTGHGRGEYSPVQQVEFERGSARPDEMIAIRYERRETLVAMGVIAEPPYRFSRRHPEPFPGALGFVPDP
ncbi:MAG: hypothetical protein IPJ97_13785 [Proteobacteria bacterium]|nr:hypothetical protein [Pseudomonadota bacterium]